MSGASVIVVLLVAAAIIGLSVYFLKKSDKSGSANVSGARMRAPIVAPKEKFVDDFTKNVPSSKTMNLSTGYSEMTSSENPWFGEQNFPVGADHFMGAY